MLVHMGAPIFTDIIRSATGAAVDTSGMTAAQRTAITSPSINQSLPHPAAGVPSATTAAKPGATTSAVKTNAPATAASSNTTTYLLAGGAAVALVAIIVVAKKHKKKKR
jgi:LPXTG-motif cell wall-anchored protein